MKAFLVIEKTEEYGIENCKYKIFSAKEKAIKYLKERNEDLYCNYDVQLCYEKRKSAYYNEQEDSVAYNDGYGGYEIAIYEEEVK